MAAALVCKAEKGVPCGECSSCVLAMSGEHPDITLIEKGKPLSRETAKGRNTIPVDDIREMIRLCSQYSYEGGNRVVLIPDAENMTFQAQNSLLKILEEPPQNTYFILTTSHPDQLLSTVISRCRPVKLIPWETAYIQKVLTDAGNDPETSRKAALASFGSIGNAYKLLSDSDYWKMQEDVLNNFFRNEKRSDILRISSSWKDRKAEADLLFNILDSNIRMLLQYRMFHDKNNAPDDFPYEWQQFASSAPIERIVSLADKISEARKQNSFNVNFQAIIEQLLLAFTGERELWVK
jgi:DNA polymerase-3 subunit delta'